MAKTSESYTTARDHLLTSRTTADIFDSVGASSGFTRAELTGGGDVVAFSSLLPHATGANETGQVRKAYVAICIPDGARLRTGEVCDDELTQPLLS